VSLQACTNIKNDLDDQLTGADDRNRTAVLGFTGGSRVLQRGLATRAELLVAMLGFGLVSSAIGVYFALAGRPWVLLFGIAGLAVGFVYTAPPFRLANRGLGELAVALAFGVGIVCGATHESKAEKAVGAFAKAWGRGDTAAMYRSLSPDARRRFSAAAFRSAYRRSAMTATARDWTVGRAKGRGDNTFALPVRVGTRIFGSVDGTVQLKASDAGVDWRPYMSFPGLRAGERLEMPYEQALAHHEIGRHLAPDDPARPHHLARAEAILADLGAGRRSL
jgi:hypothetical protein